MRQIIHFPPIKIDSFANESGDDNEDDDKNNNNINNNNDNDEDRYSQDMKENTERKHVG